MTTELIFLQVLLAFVLAAPIALRWARTADPGVFTAPFLVAVSLGLGYVWPAHRFMDGTDQFTRVWPMVFRDQVESTATALQLMIGCSLTFLLGHLLSDPGSRRHMVVATPDIWRPGSLRVTGIVFSVLGTVLFAMGLVLIGGLSAMLGGLGGRTQMFSGLNYFIMAPNLLLGFALILWGNAIQGPRISRGVILYLVFAVGVTALIGNKSTLFVFTLSLATLWHYLRRRIRTLVAVVGALAMFALMTFYEVVTREYLAVGEFVTVDTSSADSMVDRVGNAFDQNFMQLQTLTILVDRMPQHLAPQNGGTYAALIAAPIPRALWPEKPLPSTGVFTLAFWPERWLENGTTMPPGLIGEMYLNFGGLGVLGGMFAFGFIHGRVRRRFRRDPTLLNGIWFALMFALIPHYIRGDSFGPTIMLLSIALPITVAFLVAHPRKRKASVRTRAARAPAG